MKRKHFLKSSNKLSRLHQLRRALRIKRLKRQQQHIIDRNALYFLSQNDN